jgi:heme-degrading monooxygenase HmoA
MPNISTADNYLTVINLFETDALDKQSKLISAMREIVDSAEFPGWISSTVHTGLTRPGTANFIQWRSGEDLEARYAGEEFKHRTLPLFAEMTTSIRLLQTEVAFTQHRTAPGTAVEISPARDDYTVIEVFGVAEREQADLVDAVGREREWLLETPGYRSHVVLRGLAARGVEGSFVVCYSQWSDKDAYDSFRDVPESEQPVGRQKTDARLHTLTTSRDWNTYRVIHTRSAAHTPAS